MQSEAQTKVKVLKTNFTNNFIIKKIIEEIGKWGIAIEGLEETCEKTCKTFLEYNFGVDLKHANKNDEKYEFVNVIWIDENESRKERAIIMSR